MTGVDVRILAWDGDEATLDAYDVHVSTTGDVTLASYDALCWPM